MEKLRKEELKEKPSAIKIKTLRTERNMKQKEFSEWLEIPLQTIKQWELGLRSAPQWLVNLIEYRCEKSTQGEQLDIDTLYRTYVKYENDGKLLHSMDFKGHEIERLESWKRNLYDKNIPVGIIKTYKLIKEERIK